MARYVFRLEKFRITNTRALDEDTDHVSFSLKVGGKEFGPVFRHYPEVDNGEHPIDLEIGPVPVDTPATQVLVNYQILNSGHGSNSFIEDALTKGAHTLAEKLLESGNSWSRAAGAVLELLAQLDIFVVDCDGPVAVDQIQLTGADLENLTANGMHRFPEKFYPGTDSDTFCGSNSEYYVTWSVCRAPAWDQAKHSGFFIQSNHGTKGNFELVVPQPAGGLALFFRDNDAPELPWHGPFRFGESAGQITAVSLMQSNFSAAGPGPGNLELVARTQDGRLLQFFRPDAGGPNNTPGPWQGPFPLTADGTPVTGISGAPALIQSRHGVQGNFELIVPQPAGGLALFFRDNDAPELPWHGPFRFGESAGQITAVSLMQSNFSAAGPGPGNLELVVRTQDGRLLQFFRPDAGGSNNTPGPWQGPFPLP